MNAFFTGLTAPLQPYLFAIKCAILAAVLAFVGYKAWELRGDLAEHEKQEAVNEQIAHDKVVIEAERAARQLAESKADEQLSSFLQSLKDLKVRVASVNAGIAKERQSDPQFYDQSLPAGGYQQWLNARNLATESQAASTPTSAAPAPTSPSLSPWRSLFGSH